MGLYGLALELFLSGNLVSEHEPSHTLELDLVGLLWLSQDLALGLFS